MKKMKKLLALVLALALSLAVPAMAATEQEARIAEILKMKNDEKSPVTPDTLVYPYAQTFGTAVLKGEVAMLEFKLVNAASSGDQFDVIICYGSVDEVMSSEELLVVEERIYKMSDFHNGSIAMTWKADSRYPVGEYTLIALLLDEEGYAYYQDYYAVDLYVVNEHITTQGMDIMAVRDGEYYHFDGHLGIEKPICIAYGMKPHTGNRTKISVEVPNPELVSATVDAGYVYLTGKGYGRTSVTIHCGNVEQRILLSVGHFDLTGFEAVPGKTDLCVEMTDTITIRYDKSHLPYYAVWSSDNTDVVTVNRNGVVTAVGPGTATVTVDCAGISDTITYTIRNHELPEGTPVTERTATKPAMMVGHCSICGQDGAVNIIEKQVFKDTNYKEWYSDHVDYVYAQEIMNGIGENVDGESLFAPEMTVSRDMVVTVLYRLEGSPEVTGEIPFTDVRAGQWHSDAILWASQNGVVNGVGNNRFAPSVVITREQIATILYRYTQSLGVEMAEGADLDSYPDGAAVSDFAEEGMAWAVAEGLITGTVSNGITTLAPQASATRAQFATIISRYQQMFPADSE